MELRDYLRVLRNHWLGVVLIVLLAVAAAFAYNFTQPKVYAANANGFVSSGLGSDPALASVGDSLAKSRAKSYVDIAQSRATAQDVIDQLGLDTTPAALIGRVSVEQPDDTVLLKITARADTPLEAQQLADAWIVALAGPGQGDRGPEGRERRRRPAHRRGRGRRAAHRPGLPAGPAQPGPRPGRRPAARPGLRPAAQPAGPPRPHRHRRGEAVRDQRGRRDPLAPACSSTTWASGPPSPSTRAAATAPTCRPPRPSASCAPTCSSCTSTTRRG